jgi:hypothetical protein
MPMVQSQRQAYESMCIVSFLAAFFIVAGGAQHRHLRASNFSFTSASNGSRSGTLALQQTGHLENYAFCTRRVGSFIRFLYRRRHHALRTKPANARRAPLSTPHASYP